jgi:tetratricopeptide (TPR) repeat protein
MKMQISGMTPQQFDDSPTAGVDAEAILLELSYNRAVELARAGRYNEAEVLLQQIDKNRILRPVILDLRAKMFAQQGRYAEAYACWTEALSISPGSVEYSEAIEALRANALYNSWFRLAKVMVITLALVIVVFGAFILGHRTGTDSFRVAKNDKAVITDSVAENNDVQETPISEQTEKLAGEQQAVALRLEDVLKQLNTLTAKNEGLQQTIQLQSGTISDLRGQLNGVRSDLSASGDSLTKRLDSLDRQDAETQKILKEQTSKNECLLVGVAKILWVPFDLILNIGKPHPKPKVDSTEQNRLKDNYKTGQKAQR